MLKWKLRRGLNQTVSDTLSLPDYEVEVRISKERQHVIRVYSVECPLVALKKATVDGARLNDIRASAEKQLRLWKLV